MKSEQAEVVVTGGAGFIGSHLVDKLIEKGHSVFVLDDYSGGVIRNINPKARFWGVDLRDSEQTQFIMERLRPKVVFHLAANAAENMAQFSPIEVTSRNFASSVNTLTWAKRYGAKRFVFTSSIAVYGALTPPFKETDKPHPEDWYGISKKAIEEGLEVMYQTHGLEYVIARPHNVYGPRQNMRDPYRNVVTIFMNKVLKGEPLPVFGDGEQRRCFSYVEDVVNALYLCGFKKNVNRKIFNIGADKDYSINELIAAIAMASGKKIAIDHLPDRPQEVKVAIADHTQAKKCLNYQDLTSLEEGIAKTWKWAKSIGPVEPIYKELEIPSDKAPKNWLKKS